MSVTVAVIAWECGPYWVEDCGKGLYLVWVHSTTHSVKCATVHFPATPQMAFGRACAEAVRRLAKDLEEMTLRQTFSAYRY